MKNDDAKPLSKIPSAVLTVLLGAAVVVVLLVNIREGSWCRRVVSFVHDRPPARIRANLRVDNLFLNDTPSGNVWLQFEGFEPGVPPDEPDMAHLYYRGNYAVYPRRIYVAHPSQVVNNGERMVTSDGFPGRSLLETLSVENVFPSMAAMDAVVISASVHSLGRTAVEAMLLGKTVVYPLGTGFDDYLEDGATGLGYAPRDPRAMADRIDLLIENPDVGAEIGNRAQSSARELFTRVGFSGKFSTKLSELSGRQLSKNSSRVRFVNSFLGEMLAG